mmetsp:Transcript_1069/g.2213  ORF Transcript_1069/g.2213 Transcript_1069/m.2213 type:complete len:155 (-) Transcript_1069:1212-1676(-)
MTERAFVSPSPSAQVRDESRAPFPATQQIMPEPTSSTALPPSSSATCIPKWQKKAEKQQARKAKKKGGVDKLHWWQFRSDPTGCVTSASPTEDVPKQHEETTETPNAPLPQPGGPPIQESDDQYWGTFRDSWQMALSQRGGRGINREVLRYLHR